MLTLIFLKISVPGILFPPSKDVPCFLLILYSFVVSVSNKTIAIIARVKGKI